MRQTRRALDFKIHTDLNSPTVHILVLGSTNYVLLAEICIYSFLRFHSSANFTIHVDPNLESALCKRLGKLIQSKVVAYKVLRDTQSAWQTIKLEIILGMNGTREIFMDADLRWNGPLPKINSITAYLEEFALDGVHLTERLFGLLGNNIGRMANLSFFTFGDEKIAEATIHEIRFMQTSISNFAMLDDLTTVEIEKSRMSEQISLSYTLHKYSYKIKYLKDGDSRNDGRFVESCYYGATGLVY